MAASTSTPSGGFLQAWLQQLSSEGKLTGDASTIRENMKKDLEETWKKLSEWLLQQESNEIAGFCDKKNGMWPTNKGPQFWPWYMELLCNAVLEIKYFMSGIRAERLGKDDAEDKAAVITRIDDYEAYRRCIVGAVALSTIYGDHCGLTYVTEKVEGDIMERVKSTYSSRGVTFDTCKSITNADLVLGKTLLQDKIDLWTNERRRKNDGWRVGGQLWNRRNQRCRRGHGQEENLQKQRKDNAKSMATFLKLDDSKNSGQNSAFSLADVLIVGDMKLDEGKLEQVFQDAMEGGTASPDVKKMMEKITNLSQKTEADVCMKERSKSFCERLKCAKQHWEVNNKQQQNFWDHVNGKLEELLPTGTTTSNDVIPGANCNDNSMDNANKEACRHIATLLKKMYQNSNGTSEKYSEQIIKCVLLKEYAKKLKKQAKEKGFCSIDKGLQEAFNQSKEIMQKATDNCKGASAANCFECKWDSTTDDELKSCPIPNSSGQKDQVNTKVLELLNDNPETKDPKIQQTLIAFNKNNTLCERVNCAAHWWAEKKNGQEDVWKKVQKEVVQPLGQAMSTNTDYSLDSHCNNLSWKQKEVCLLFARGLHHMYKNTDSKEEDRTKLFERTMMCTALRAYAKKLEEDAAEKEKNGTGSCNIKGGIQQAFGASKTIMEKASGTCTGSNAPNCFECTWDAKNELDNCIVGQNSKTQNVHDQLTTFLDDEKTELKESLDKIYKTDLCDRAGCVAGRWVENGNAQKGVSGATRSWGDLWKENDGVWKELKELSDEMKSKKNNFSSHCDGLNEDNKEACMLIASGLKSIYEIKANKSNVDRSTKKDLEDQLFKRTMQCVLLNAFADKLEQLPCSKEKNVKNAIDTAFGKSDNIKTETGPCNSDGDKCFTCSRFDAYKTCQIKENGNNQKVSDKMDPMLYNDSLGMKKIEDQALKDICKPCTGEGNGNFCDQLTCVAKKWGERNKKTSSGEIPSWDAMKTDIDDVVKALLNRMKDTDKQSEVDTYCTADKDGNPWNGSDAHGVANKTACKLVAAGLHHISNIHYEYNENSKPGKDVDNNPYDNQEFKQFVSCLWLKEVAKRMKEQSPICDIEPGIKAAFAEADVIAETNCTNGRPCIECKWDEKTKDELDKCQIGNNDKVKDKLNDFLTEDKKTDVDTTLEAITKLDKGSLCNRLRCIEARVQALAASKGPSQSNASTLWEKTGEVGQLWNQLSQAMTENGKAPQNECDKMGEKSDRDATHSEKTACNYLHAGFTKLKEITASNGNSYPILNNSSLKQTMGCFLLHAYAKQMKDGAKCEIEAGIKKAFETYSKGLSSNGTCNGSSSGKGQCVPCQWNENDYDDCTITTITTTDTNGTFHETTQTPAKDKLQQVQDKIDDTATDNLTEVNKMNKLCDYIKCAAPKWFKNHIDGTNNSPTKNWCDFWDKAVKDELQKMFKRIQDKGKNNPNTACNDFGDGNKHSVERKACNHITAGLDYINTIEGIDNGQPSAKENDKFFKQTMMCAALNFYADQIIKKSQDKCPIHGTKIIEMFNEWNGSNSSCLNSGGSGNGNKDCFLCTRQPDFKVCQLSVDSSLINTTSSSQQSGQNCNTNATDAVKVKDQMNKFLNEDNSTSKSISQVKKTLSTITDMGTFCSKIQCAAKQYGKIKKGTGPNGTVTWTNIESDVKDVLTDLLNNMTESKNQAKAAEYCNDDSKWNALGHKQSKTNKAACLLFAAGLQHIYGRPNGHQKGQFNGPSFGQTMGCLFLKEYAKQLKEMANKKKRGHSWVHPYCSIKDGITHAFKKSEEIMNASSKCNNGTNSCFVCKQNEDYGTCQIGQDNVGNKATELFADQSKQNQMQETLENTVCPILLTDLLTPFLPLAPVSIGLSAMAYYLWKYFGPPGKGGARFRRSPTEIPGSSVQEQVLDHVEEAGPHEYQLVKERKPRSAPTRTKRSGGVNRRTIIEIHFEVLDECQKGDTQLNQKDFLELLVQEFMGSEFMEEEQVPKEEVLMEGVPMERAPMERVPNLGSVFMV
ncbi:SICAvar, type I [Plasmodium knowlesi strain H]|uniref:SICAvar, type I n=1 Tax=Plasmodium knowlesi (strain H) TaxID=5851 RepID=A0A679KVI8_PLAKH|nr:SICAvar, type I [Plasmodium knowlesi strain H]CAA9987535.1 SICAvar, type I [Plasmodium knowlesi strain H]VVS77009.1 SICAvar, type I [Plasmodium knowlesi strain H]